MALRNATKLCAGLLAVSMLMLSFSILGVSSLRSQQEDAIVLNSVPSVRAGTFEASPENVPPVAVIGDLVTGYLGTYYNLPADHPDVEGAVTGVVPGDSPYNHDWYSDQYFSFQRTDLNLEFGSGWFPVNDGLPGDPQYFAVRWQANISVPDAGNYSFLMGSDDDSWLFIDDIMVIDLGGIHALQKSTGTIYLDAGIHYLEIYFAERHLVQSGFYFEFLDEGVEIVSVVYWDDIVADIGQTVAFKGSCSYDVDGTIQDYSWDFGDEETGTGQLPSHTYYTSGIFTVTLTVTDDDGTIGTDTCLVTISNMVPVADAGPDQTVCVGDSAAFDGSGSFDLGGTIASYSWSFGDGLAGNGKTMTHIYAQTGVYTVTLTVMDNEGALDTDECAVTVRSLPNLAWTLEYLDPADQTIVNSTGIWFHTTGAYPDYLCYVPYNQTFQLPTCDYGTYLLYNRTVSLHYRLTITNLDSIAHSNVKITTIQERHNDMTIWDRFGRLDLHKGDQMGGSSMVSWTVTLQPGQTLVLEDNYCFEGRGWGLDQTHLIISVGSHTIIDEPEAGVYCPP